MSTTLFETPFRAVGCRDCRDQTKLGFDFTMAFQPIVDLETRRPFAYEALVRGPNGEGAGTVLTQVNDSNRYRFDQACRVKAIELASKLGLHKQAGCLLSINFMPNAVYRPETCIRATLEASREFGFPTECLMFEVTEGERVADPGHLVNIFNEYRKQGFTTAIDDFGAGYSGLNLLATFQPQVLKLDMELTRDICNHNARQAIVAGVLLVAQKLGITVVAEGVETQSECDCLAAMGVRYIQGYLFAKPGFESLPSGPF